MISKRKEKIIERNGGMQFIEEHARMGSSIVEIAKEMDGVFKEDIYKYLRKNGTSYAEIKRNNPVLETFEQKMDYDGGMDYLKILARHGFTSNEVARRYGYRTDHMLYVYLQKHGTSWSELKEK